MAANNLPSSKPPQVLTAHQIDAAVRLMGHSRQLRILPIDGESMVPMLRPGQRVAVQLDAGRLERGDLLLYRQLDYLVVHRLLGPADREDGTPRLRTRGDGRIALDPPLERSRVRGRVVAIERDGHWWDLDGGAARFYALCIALHDLFWAAMAVLGARFDRLAAGLGIRSGLAALVARTDRFGLHRVDALLFRRLHRRHPGIS